MQLVSSQRCFDGHQNVYKHASTSCACDMTFAIYLPPQSQKGRVPVLWYLSGLTCTHENAMTKANFQEYAAEYGLAIVYPDTSPRGDQVPDHEDYDLGQGAGFYVNATQEPWSAHFRMHDYILQELPGLVFAQLPQLDADRQGIFGHSMGGHGALTLAVGNPDRFRSVSAFAPICNPLSTEWGRKQFSAYLGPDESVWQAHDASFLMKEQGWKSDLLVDQGTSDQFLELLRPESLKQAMESRGQAGEFRFHEGYDHSYFFISTFAREHLAWHAERLLSEEEALMTPQ